MVGFPFLHTYGRPFNLVIYYSDIFLHHVISIGVRKQSVGDSYLPVSLGETSTLEG